MGRKTVLRNKSRGRAFQAKLARMVSGYNVGTLGGEDVMTTEFSYEAKTWDAKAKSHNGTWRGAKLLESCERQYPDKRFYLCLSTDGIITDSALYLIRWQDWVEYFDGSFEGPNLDRMGFYVGKFIGFTWMRQAEANCPDGKIPIVVVHVMGERHHRDIVVIRKLYWDSLNSKEAL